MHGKVVLHGHMLWLKQFFGGQYPFKIYSIGITFILIVGYFVTFILHIICKLSNDKYYRIDFGNIDVEVITTHFKDIRENSDVKIDDALTEWDMIKIKF